MIERRLLIQCQAIIYDKTNHSPFTHQRTAVLATLMALILFEVQSWLLWKLTFTPCPHVVHAHMTHLTDLFATPRGPGQG